jgi:hypothetical protein
MMMMTPTLLAATLHVAFTGLVGFSFAPANGAADLRVILLDASEKKTIGGVTVDPHIRFLVVPKGYGAKLWNGKEEQKPARCYPEEANEDWYCYDLPIDRQFFRHAQNLSGVLKVTEGFRENVASMNQAFLGAGPMNGGHLDGEDGETVFRFAAGNLYAQAGRCSFQDGPEDVADWAVLSLDLDKEVKLCTKQDCEKGWRLVLPVPSAETAIWIKNLPLRQADEAHHTESAMAKATKSDHFVAFYDLLDKKPAAARPYPYCPTEPPAPRVSALKALSVPLITLGYPIGYTKAGLRTPDDPLCPPSQFP